MQEVDWKSGVRNLGNMHAKKAKNTRDETVQSISHLSIPLSSLKILKEHESKLRRWPRDKSFNSASSSGTPGSDQELSAGGIMKMAVKKLNPCLMVVSEPKASTTSPTLLGRFNGALSVFSAVFHCLEDCFDRDRPIRAIVEEEFLRKGIRNSIATEGKGRLYCMEKISFWRSFFARFGIFEIPLSDSALYQAKLASNSNVRWSSCSLDTDGISLILGWNGTPIKFLSPWKFSQE